MLNNTSLRSPIVIYTQDSKSFAGKTAADVVKRMLESNAFTCAKSVDEYMHSVSRRYSALCNVDIRKDTAENFLTDLHDCGAIYLSSGH
jgi:hypothetical protein